MYERLPNICYWCGRLTHSDKECSLWIRSNGMLKEDDKQFGSRLRAMILNPSRKMVVRVAGYEEEFLGNGLIDGEDDVSEIAELIGRGMGSIPVPSVDSVTITTSVLPKAEVVMQIGYGRIKYFNILCYFLFPS